MTGTSENWATSGFPHPNPHFPDLPRPRRWGSYWTIFVLIVIGVGCIALIPALKFETFGPVLLLGVLGCLCFMVAILVLNDLWRARIWKIGRIVPARILEAPKGPSRSVIWLVLGAIPLVGVLTSAVSGWVLGKRNVAVLAIRTGAKTKTYGFPALRHWKYYRDNLDVWVLISTKGEPLAIELIAPKRYHFQDVPGDVSSWLDENIAPEFLAEGELHRQRVFEHELKEAAKANTRAMKAAFRGDKRPS